MMLSNGNGQRGYCGPVGVDPSSYPIWERLRRDGILYGSGPADEQEERLRHMIDVDDGCAAIIIHVDHVPLQ